jgi:hypothetical protein
LAYHLFVLIRLVGVVWTVYSPLYVASSWLEIVTDPSQDDTKGGMLAVPAVHDAQHSTARHQLSSALHSLSQEFQGCAKYVPQPLMSLHGTDF